MIPVAPHATTDTPVREDGHQRALESPLLLIDGKPADEATLKRVMNAKPSKKASYVRCNQPKAFSILR